MTDIKRIVQEKINESIENLGDDKLKHTVKSLKPVYFVEYSDGKIETPCSDEFLTDREFKIAFAFPCISYIPNSRENQTFLKPVIITNKLEISVGSGEYKNWKLHFFNQDLRRQSLPFEVLIKRQDIDFEQRIYSVDKKNIDLHLRLLCHVLDCSSKRQAEFLLSMYKKEEEINELYKSIRLKNRELNKLSTGSDQDL